MDYLIHRSSDCKRLTAEPIGDATDNDTGKPTAEQTDKEAADGTADNDIKPIAELGANDTAKPTTEPAGITDKSTTEPAGVTDESTTEPAGVTDKSMTEPADKENDNYAGEQADEQAAAPADEQATAPADEQATALADEQAAALADEQATALADEQAAALADAEAAAQTDKDVGAHTVEKADKQASAGAYGANHLNDPARDDETKNLTPHPAADIFPTMAPAAFDRLVADIKEKGQLQPIIIHSNMILDGRHRYLACQRLQIKPSTIEWIGEGSPEDFVVSMNLLRRHLTESQRAVIAAKLTTFGHGGDRRSKQTANLPPGVSQKKAAEMFNVSERSVRHAVAVISKGTPELLHAVERNELAVSAAADTIKSATGRQTEITEPGKSAAMPPLKAARRIDKHAEADVATLNLELERLHKLIALFNKKRRNLHRWLAKARKRAREVS